VGFIGSVVISRFAARERSGEGAGRRPGDAVAEGVRRHAHEQQEREAAVDTEHHGASPEGEVR
jgi:multicomponent Na+:H+ antiporter subunit F